MTGAPTGHYSVETPTYRRGDLWMVDFGDPVGMELGKEHPAVIVSRFELNKHAGKLGIVIVVPGTSTRRVNAQGQTWQSHEEVAPSVSNGLHQTTYFMAERVRSISIRRLRRVMGAMEPSHVRKLENRLCLVMDLFS